MDPSHEEFQQASLRIRARLWMRRARMWTGDSETPGVLRDDSAEREQQDVQICERWYGRYGYG